MGYLIKISVVRDHLSFVYVTLSALCRNRLFFYLFYLKLIRLELEVIENEANRMFKSFRSNSCMLFVNQNHLLGRFKRKRFVWFRKYYQLVCTMKDCINLTFGWSNLATILFNFIYLLTDLNWFCTHFRSKSYTFKICKLTCSCLLINLFSQYL